jgi:hypothetical protein
MTNDLQGKDLSGDLEAVARDSGLAPGQPQLHGASYTWREHSADVMRPIGDEAANVSK